MDGWLETQSISPLYVARVMLLLGTNITRRKFSYGRFKLFISMATIKSRNSLCFIRTSLSSDIPESKRTFTDTVSAHLHCSDKEI